MTKQKTTKLLVFRFSALGDVAMVIPVLWSLVRQYPDTEITFVSKPFAKTLFSTIPNVTFFSIDDKGRHSGFWGLLKLYSDLKKMNKWDGIADLHDVLRTKILRLLFWFSGVKVSSINKGRKGKRALTRKNNKQFTMQKHTVIRYSDVLYSFGYDVKHGFRSVFTKQPVLSQEITSKIGEKKGKWLGIAPFAKHRGKAYPLENIKQTINLILEANGVTILLFGSKGQEQQTLENISSGNNKIISIAGLFTLFQELEIMANLDLMVSMDSANMHLASLVGTPVVSIWGATHPYAGFYGWNQSHTNAIQVDLECRPCSVFGNKPCFRHDYACLYRVDPSKVAGKILEQLNY